MEVHQGGKWARLLPAPALSVSYAIAFEHPLLRHQAIDLDVTLESFVEQIAPARTFGFLSEVEALQRQGLARGGSLDNAIVIGESAILNGSLRFEDEFVRHKVLDAIGDLALLGHPLVARLEAYKAGHAVHVAHSGEAGLELAARERPEIIFLDIGLPDRDGYSVAATLREDPALRGTFLVALTGWGAERDRQRTRAAGFDLHLTKPVGPDDIASALARVG